MPRGLQSLRLQLASGLRVVERDRALCRTCGEYHAVWVLPGPRAPLKAVLLGCREEKAVLEQ